MGRVSDLANTVINKTGPDKTEAEKLQHLGKRDKNTPESMYKTKRPETDVSCETASKSQSFQAKC